MFKCFKDLLNTLININISLVQIYGEVNRIRLIMGEKSEKGQWIEDFDNKQSGYVPFFDSKKNYKKFTAMKKEKE
jgi:hypothetical protein